MRSKDELKSGRGTEGDDRQDGTSFGVRGAWAFPPRHIASVPTSRSAQVLDFFEGSYDTMLVSVWGQVRTPVLISEHRV